MPFYKTISVSSDTTLYFWKITEDFSTLFKSVSLKANSLERVRKMKSENHQKGFLSVRMLLQHVGYSDYDLDYDEFGKPHLVSNQKLENDNNTLNLGFQKYISISHSHEFSMIAISDKLVGIDLEIVKEKILKIASRFMNVSHLVDIPKSEKMMKATVIWGIKESVFKIKNEQGISFPNHIFEEDFLLNDKKSKAILKFNNEEEVFTVLFDFIEEYVYVCAFVELDKN